MAQPYCIAIDWLEVCCYGAPLRNMELSIDGRKYYVTREERSTALFRDFFVVTHKNLEYAYIRQNPRLSRIKKSTSCVKLNNRVLYHEGCIDFLLKLLKALHLRYHGITRLDLAYDCNKFFDGRNPHRFIRDFVNKPMSEKGGMYLAGSKEYTLHGRKSISNDGQMNYIQFGGKSSTQKGYIYNKSLELKEVKDKPWIRDMWERNGLKNDDKNPVWRAEISIRSESKDLLNLETGQLFALAPNYINCYENIKKVFHFFAARVFDFRINQGQKNRRHFPRLVLFDKGVEITCLPRRVSNKCDSGRSEKMCKNKLQSLSRTYVDMSESVRSSLYAAIEWIENLSSLKTARYKSEQCKHYLDTFACCRFMAEEDFAYINACYERMQTQREADRISEQLYERYLKSKVLMAALEES